ncbi:bacterial transcriptional activator domain-containing protein [Nocardia terpenica]|uniref:bacterial transcriptional activator domain-containing protein n=1 Tax=Nocardia terpenica TaxID=455432 RepID=UPI0018941F58|nr:bacterial transcriptional activator domain-containing protein [Nocardia terpenica]MBF6061360.1 bacterial transcriptional activator domain-containing protein [Nocardia terpenica]MBF6105411.1 bacterial transcriptional activator domain-containing protein [Nocardia terpenica]MBF6113119.1 bacterial transcriptional activator domain-containing protein [Nocardia terpenica]MBF6119249.1 bacterial transcriptional activator domain-containing protein [Nocardia terpenica]MBF6152897.1 bacterial transcript
MTLSRELGAPDPAGPQLCPVQIRLLGRFAVYRGEVRVAPRVFGGRQARRLLRLLAVRRGTLVSKDAAAEALWADRLPADPAGNVEILVSRIRGALGDRSLIETGPAGYTLVGDDRITVDAEVFAAGVARGRALLDTDAGAALGALTEALALWRGEPLLEDTDAEWARAPRRRWADALVQALDGAATAALTVGDAGTAASWARIACQRQPLREVSALLLVRALAAGGDRAAALTAFDAFRARLGEELGVDPSAAALAVRQRVLLDEDATAPGPSARPGRGAVLAESARDLLALVSVLGRPTPVGLAAAVTGRGLRETLAELDGLRRTGFVRATAEGWVSAGPGWAVVEPQRRARLHLLVAETLQGRGADPIEVAMHLRAGGAHEGAARLLAAAADDRLRRIRDEEALRCAQAGLAQPAPGPHRSTLLAVRAEVYRRRGQLARARADLVSALEDTAAHPDRSRLLARLAILETRSRSTALGDELAKLAIAEAGADAAARGQALAAAAIIDLTLPRFGRARRRFRQAQALLELAGDPHGAARLAYWRSMASFMTGRIARAEQELNLLVQLPLLPPELLRLWYPRTSRGYARVFLGRLDGALADIEAALSWARSVDHPAVQCNCLWQRSEALAAAGAADRALDSAQAALELARRMGHAEGLAAAQRGLGIAWQAAGDGGRAELAFRRSMAAARRVPLFAGWAAARLGLVLVQQGRLDEAAPMIDAAAAHAIPLVRHEGRWAYAELLHARADPAATRVAADALQAARSAGHLALVPRLAALT